MGSRTAGSDAVFADYSTTPFSYSSQLSSITIALTIGTAMVVVIFNVLQNFTFSIFLLLDVLRTRNQTSVMDMWLIVIVQCCLVL